jgi:predicted NodU family carbamoyl transferase
MIVLGISAAVGHDPSAALFVDGELVAAAEEERFLHDKHAKGRDPCEATRFCLDYAGIDALNMFYGSELRYLMMEDILICEQDPDTAKGQ